MVLAVALPKIGAGALVTAVVVLPPNGLPPDAPPNTGAVVVLAVDPVPPKENVPWTVDVDAGALEIPPNTGALAAAVLVFSPKAKVFVADSPPNTGAEFTVADMVFVAVVDDDPNGLELVEICAARVVAPNPENVDDVGALVAATAGLFPPNENIDGMLVGAEVATVGATFIPPKLKAGFDWAATFPPDGISAGVGSLDGVATAPNAKVLFRLTEGAGVAAAVKLETGDDVAAEKDGGAVVVAAEKLGRALAVVAGFEVPNANVGTGILLGSGCLGAAVEARAPLPNVIGAIEAAEVVAGVLANENIPGIDDLGASVVD